MNYKLLSTIIFLSFFSLSPAHALITTFSGDSATELIIYLFNIGITVGSFLAVIMLVLAGVDYMTSSGEEGKMDQVRKKIQNIVFGLVILFGSYMILNTINPQLTQVSLDKLPVSVVEPLVVPPDKGVYLYKEDGITKMVLTKTNAFIPDSFVTKSIKFENPDNFDFGAILFNKGNLEDRCSWVTSDLADIGSSSGDQNNPPIKGGKLGSVLIFKMPKSSSAPSVTFFNNIDCKEKSEEYGKKPVGKDWSCTVNGSGNISEVCPNFVGGVISMKINGGGGVILKDKTKENIDARCHFFPKPVYSDCVNVIKYSYVYNPSFEALKEFSPKSFTILPMINEGVMKVDPIIQ
ncbi:MAG: pilin [Candidatus Pacebacteria bacterium]|nr:pilin [Candidatus Paceibacterota bacterium]